jgi:hypothetical protein
MFIANPRASGGISFQAYWRVVILSTLIEKRPPATMIGVLR